MAKREVMMLYGEKTVQVNYRIPESKKDEIDAKIKGVLKEYENLQRVKIDVRESEQKVLKDLVFQKPVAIDEAFEKIEKKSKPADSLVSKLIPMQDKANIILSNVNDMLPEKIDQEIVDDKIEYEILESFPFGIEKFEDFGKNKAIYFYEPDYYTRVVNEKAKHISYGSAVNYLKSK